MREGGREGRRRDGAEQNGSRTTIARGKGVKLTGLPQVFVSWGGGLGMRLVSSAQLICEESSTIFLYLFILIIVPSYSPMQKKYCYE